MDNIFNTPRELREAPAIPERIIPQKPATQVIEPWPGGEADVVVTAVPNNQGQYTQSGKTPHGGKAYVGIKFKITTGEFVGNDVSLTLWPDPTDAKFRHQVMAILDTTQLNTVGIAAIEDAFAQYSFEARVRLDHKGYLAIKIIHQRVKRIEIPENLVYGEIFEPDVF